MDIEERAAGRAIVVSLIGRLDGAGASGVEATVAGIVKRGTVRVVLDCERMSYVSSAGLRAFLLCARHCQRQGGRLSIAHLKPECRTVIELSGFLSFIDYHATVEAALAAPSRAPDRGDRREPEAQSARAIVIEERPAGSAVVVSLEGHLDGVGAPALETRLFAIVKRGDTRVVLDCARMRHVSSAGLRAVLVGAKTCQQSGGKLMIADLQPQCRTVLKMSGFLSFIEYFETSDAALAALG